jgi:septal ring factor EnvC (AmiA/AmiB activator)
MRGWALTLALAIAPAVGGAQGVTEQAAQAAADLQQAIAALDAASGARDRVAALTQTIRAHEDGLAVLREALRQAELRDTALTLQFETRREQVAQLLGTLGQLEATPGPLLLLHPLGALGTARSGMLLADVTPALQAEAAALKAELAELRDLRALEVAAADTLAAGLASAQEARTALSQAISDRTDLPKRLTEDPAALQRLLDSAETLDAFANGLVPEQSAPAAADFETAEGSLPLPVLGSVLRRPMEADAAGVRRPGLTLATGPRALVTAPWPATLRYLGPLLDYGNVMILEPAQGYLLVLAGMGTLYGSVGDVVAAGTPLGLMGGGAPGVAEFLVQAEDDGGARATETLYLELRRGAEPIDPASWFAATRE